MMSSALRLLGSVIAVSVCVLAWPAGASAQDEAFKQGLAARGDRKWPEAASAMRRAIQADARESTRKVRTGLLGAFGGGTEYFPYYFLGEALKNQGDCAGAVTAWETSEEHKAVLGHAEFAASLRAGSKECASKGVLLRDDYRQQVSASDQVYNEALGMAERVTKVKTTNPDLWRPDVDAEYERARTELGSAQGRLVRARQSRVIADFAESRSAAARATALLRPLEARLGAAINTRTLIGQQSSETQQLLASAETADRAIDAAKVALSPVLGESRESGRATMARARERLGQADKTQNAATASEALRLAQEASDTLGNVLEEVKKLARGVLEQRLQEVVAAATEEFSFVATSFATLERLAAEKPGMIPPNMAAERDALQKEQSTLQRRFENARRSENVASVQDVTRLALNARMRIDNLIKAFGLASLRDRGVNAALEEGARLYFTGEYQRALGALGPVGNLSDVPLQVHIHLFRAASLYALYVRSGETDQALRNDALVAVQHCKQSDPAFEPNPRAFSPRFISFFHSAGAQEAQTTSSP